MASVEVAVGEPNARVLAIADLRAFLTGTWRIARTVKDARSGQDGVFDGTALFAPLPDGGLLLTESGTMRLGVQSCTLKAGSKARALYNAEVISERHRHRYEFNNNYKQILSDNGLDLVAESAENELVEMVELPNHPFFIACQFHPEFTSTPRDGHPLFEGFIRAARDHHLANQPSSSPSQVKAA